MKRYKVSSQEALDASVMALSNGQVIAAPTETVYGLMARWDNEQARDKIYSLKCRPQNKQLQMLVSSVHDLDSYQILNRDWFEKIGKTFWPGPLTLIIEESSGTTIGVRIPSHDWILNLIRTLGAPLAATSANLSGRPAASTPDEAVAELDGQPAVLIDGGVVTVTGGTASTVASIEGRKLTILREGPISLEDLDKCLRS